MSTSAQQRLNRLFSKTPLPPKPIPESSLTREDEDQKNIPQSTPQSSVPVRTQNTLSCKDVLTSDHNTTAKHSMNLPPQLANVVTDEASHDEAVPVVEPKADAIKFFALGRKSPITDSTDSGNKTPTINETSIKPEDKTQISTFCVFTLAAKFPYKYFKDPTDQVSKQFFAQNKFYARSWDIWYLHAPESFGADPIILVPLDQMQQLTREISTAFKIEVSVPPYPFTVPFYDDDTPKPLYLDVSRSREDFRDLQKIVPNVHRRHGECPKLATQATKTAFEKFHNKCRRIIYATKTKRSSGQRKNATHRLSEQDKLDQVKRVQRYFGLKPSPKTVINLDSLSWADKQDFYTGQLSEPKLDTLQTDKTAPFEFNKQPIIICIDVESFERDHSIITEIGVSTLDTADLVSISPGEFGENWTRSIRSRHFLIKGREQIVNSKYIQGNPRGFRFGSSDVVDLLDIADTVDKCFEAPFSAAYTHDGSTAVSTKAKSKITNDGVESITGNIDTSDEVSEQRNIIFLGHNVGSDISYLSNLGSGIFGNTPSKDPAKAQARQRVLSSILEVLDTAVLYQTMAVEDSPKSLATICRYLGIDAFSLHNAGNDARYTLECFVRLAVRARKLNDGSVSRVAIISEAQPATGLEDLPTLEALESGLAQTSISSGIFEQQTAAAFESDGYESDLPY